MTKERKYRNPNDAGKQDFVRHSDFVIPFGHWSLGLGHSRRWDLVIGKHFLLALLSRLVNLFRPWRSRILPPRVALKICFELELLRIVHRNESSRAEQNTYQQTHQRCGRSGATPWKVQTQATANLRFAAAPDCPAKSHMNGTSDSRKIASNLGFA
jgi:hypothetical protein